MISLFLLILLCFCKSQPTKKETSPLQKTFHLSAPKMKTRHTHTEKGDEWHKVVFYHTIDGCCEILQFLGLPYKPQYFLTFRTDTRHTQGSNTPVPALALILQMNENLFFQRTQWRWTDSLQKETKGHLFQWVWISKCFTKFKKVINELW